MRSVVKLPKVSDTDDELTVVVWRVAVGEEVVAGAALVEVESSKTTVELPSPVSGRVVEILVGADQDAPVGTPICVIETA